MTDPAARLQVMFVIPSFTAAGAERTFVNVANHLDRRRFAPTIAVYRDEGALRSELDPDVPVIDLQCRRGRWAVIPLARAIRRHRPDVIVSTLLYPNAVAVLARILSGTHARVIVRESNHHTAAGRPTSGLAARVVAWAYRRADAVICLSKGVADDCIRRTGVGQRRVRVIYNPIAVDRIRERLHDALPDPAGARDDSNFEIVAAGRLVEQKGFDLLVDACANLTHLNWKLTIIGEGPLRGELVDLASRLGVSDRVRLPGAQPNPYPWIARADLFVLSSRWEGFGHVIAEAMACGIPVLAASCPSGPDEIITNDVDGLLCEPNSSSALAEGIRRLAGLRGDRERYAAQAAHTVRRFDIATIIAEYQAALLEVSGGGARLMDDARSRRHEPMKTRPAASTSVRER